MSFPLCQMFSIHSIIDPAFAIRYSGGLSSLVVDAYVPEPAFLFNVQLLASGWVVIHSMMRNEFVSFDGAGRKLALNPYDPNDEGQMWGINSYCLPAPDGSCSILSMLSGEAWSVDSAPAKNKPVIAKAQGSMRTWMFKCAQCKT